MAEINIIKDKKIKQEIAERLSLSKFTKVQQDKILAVLMEAVATKINIEVWQKLSKEEKNELSKVSQKGWKKVLEFISSKIENFPGLVEGCTREVMNDFKRRRGLI